MVGFEQGEKDTPGAAAEFQEWVACLIGQVKDQVNVVLVVAVVGVVEAGEAVKDRSG